MNDKLFIMPGAIRLVLIIPTIYIAILSIKFMKKGIKTFDLLIKYLEKKDNEKTS